MSEREREIQTDSEAQRYGSSGASATPSAVGAMLRATRQRYGWDLEDVERALRIRIVHLQAIEDGRFEDLPGPAYAVGFVRAYADHLGLEREEVVSHFRDEISDLPRRTRLNFPTPIPESRVPSGAILLISLAVAAVAYGGWYYLTMKNRSGLELVAEVPQKLADMFKPQYENPPATEAAASTVTHEESSPSSAPAPAPEANAQPGTASVAASSPTAGPAPAAGPAPTCQRRLQCLRLPQRLRLLQRLRPRQRLRPLNACACRRTGELSGSAASQPPRQHPAGRTDRRKTEPSVSEQFAALPVAPGDSGGEGSVFGKSNTNARIVIRANADSRVQVRDNDGELILTRMLRAGDSYRVPNKDGLTLLTGNAGALEIYVDGRKAPPIGPGGAIRRDVALDADRLMAGTAAADN